MEPDRGEARRQLVQELQQQEYAAATPGLFERAVLWLGERLSELTLPAGVESTAGTVALLAVLVLVVLVALWMAGPVRLSARTRPGPGVFGATSLSADEHRAAADEHAAAGRWAQAVRERFRAVVRALEERTLLEPRPGRTASEAAREAAQLLPGLAGDLAGAAQVFDDVVYGEHPAGPPADARLRQLDESVAAATPQLSGNRT